MAIQLTHHNRILCSTGALIGRPNGRDFTLLGPCTQKLTCDGFEFMGSLSIVGDKKQNKI